MSFREFEIKVRKAFGELINPGPRNVWQDNQRKDGIRYCAKTTNGMFITGNAESKTIFVFKCEGDRYPTRIPA